jgi:hypothetical protein
VLLIKFEDGGEALGLLSAEFQSRPNSNLRVQPDALSLPENQNRRQKSTASSGSALKRSASAHQIERRANIYGLLDGQFVMLRELSARQRNYKLISCGPVR